MGYIIYGKRTEPIHGTDGVVYGPDKTFAALNYSGIRVSRLAQAAVYDTREAAQSVIDKNAGKHGVIFEIRKK